MDALTLFGLFAMTGMVATYTVENRHHIYKLLFGGFCGLAALYAALAGTWPFAVLEAIWAVVAVIRWRRHDVSN